MEDLWKHPRHPAEITTGRASWNPAQCGTSPHGTAALRLGGTPGRWRNDEISQWKFCVNNARCNRIDEIGRTRILSEYSNILHDAPENGE